MPGTLRKQFEKILGHLDSRGYWDLLLVARQLPQKLFQRHLQLKQILPPLWRWEEFPGFGWSLQWEMTP